MDITFGANGKIFSCFSKDDIFGNHIQNACSLFGNMLGILTTPPQHNTTQVQSLARAVQQL